jgi:mannose-6-phosphate isomerase class I
LVVLLRAEERGDDLTPVNGDLILKLHKEFPGDPGAFCVYFLNVVELQPGEAMFLEANLPHAYLSGGESRATVIKFITTVVWGRV